MLLNFSVRMGTGVSSMVKIRWLRICLFLQAFILVMPCLLEKWNLFLTLGHCCKDILEYTYGTLLVS
jgi:hypothetical protein